MAQLAIAKIGQDGADQRGHLQQPGLGWQPRRQGVIDVDGGVVEGLLVVGGVFQIRRHPDEVIGRRHQPVIVQHYLHHPQTDEAELAPGMAVGCTCALGLDLLVAQIERIGLWQMQVRRMVVTYGHGGRIVLCAG